MSGLKYLPLSRPRDFRLLQISPGPVDEPLKLEINHFTLDDTNPPAYEALSYAWGQTVSPVTVHVLTRSDSNTVVDGELSIGENLRVALRQLRNPLTPRTIWADAICINQEDLAERTQQVLMMADVYRLARQVVAFIGPAANDSNYAIDLLDRMGNAIDVDFNTGHIKTSTAQSNEPGWADMRRPLPFGHRDYLSISNLIEREWFERLWIRQEIGLGGHKGILQCGEKLLRWPSFCRAIFIIHRKPVFPGTWDPAHLRTFQARLSNVDTLILYSMRPFGFTNLRQQIGNSKCSDPRDRIYGILSQLDTDHISIIPDYTKSVAEVYTDVTQKHIHHFGKLDILTQCELSEKASAHSLPSWVPDWSSPRKSEEIHELAPELFHLMPTFSYMDQRLLRAYGIYVTRVTATFPFQEEDLHSESVLQTAQELRRLLLEIGSNQNVQAAHKSREHFLEACCRNLWLNNFSERWMPPVPHESSFDDCLTIIDAITNPDGLTPDLPTLRNISRCMARCRGTCTARTLFVTRDGLLGIGPKSVATGDEVCSLFGCRRPMLLRPVAGTAVYPSNASSQPEYRLVGECHVDGAMYGEFVLGNLPDNHRGLLNAHSSDLWPPAYMECRSKVIHKEDTRAAAFLGELRKKGLLNQPTMEELQRLGAKDILIQAGIEIRTFDLI
ncbi:hypothetical protein G3M48_000773 [Beauveria asiatica]|uniref:Heterokaryon incompatibility domain-containing protein n=1 Tax=Beauveria asiatica TaxID=1069075 RepID=A0AAW0S0V9_9HYPO